MQPTSTPKANEAMLLRSAIASETIERDRLAQILDDYLAAIERGGSITPERLLSQHPADAEKLRLYLEGLELFQVAAKGESVIIPAQQSSSGERIATGTAAGQGAFNLLSSPSTATVRSHPRLMNVSSEK